MVLRHDRERCGTQTAAHSACCESLPLRIVSAREGGGRLVREWEGCHPYPAFPVATQLSYPYCARVFRQGSSRTSRLDGSDKTFGGWQVTSCQPPKNLPDAGRHTFTAS